MFKSLDMNVLMGIVTELLYTKLFLSIVNVFGGLTPVISTGSVSGEYSQTSQARLIVNAHRWPLSICDLCICKNKERRVSHAVEQRYVN